MVYVVTEDSNSARYFGRLPLIHFIKVNMNY